MPTDIYVGNAGDSRAVLAARKGDKLQAIEMSIDHKPDNPSEKARIEKAGGFVEDNRVKGILNLSKSLGDLEYKSDTSLSPKAQMIKAVSERKYHCLSSPEAVDFVGELIKKKEKVSGVVEEMFDKIIATDVASSGGVGCDNMTCVVIQFISK